MGMFDYVKCDLPLPDGWDMANDYVGLQSKDFDCTMTTIRITAEGRLLIERYETYVVPKEERDYPDAKPGSWQEVCGMLGKRDRRWEDLNYHGDFEFGGLEDLKDDYWVDAPRHTNGGWMQKRYRHHDYIARFNDGQLVWLKDANAASGTSGSAQDPQGLDPKGAGPVPKADAQ